VVEGEAGNGASIVEAGGNAGLEDGVGELLGDALAVVYDC